MLKDTYGVGSSVTVLKEETRRPDMKGSWSMSCTSNASMGLFSEAAADGCCSSRYSVG